MTTRAQRIEELYVKERLRLERQVQRRLRSSNGAADIVQDVFLRVWERAVEFNGDAAAFLNRSARNAAIDHLRSERRRLDFERGITEEQYAPPPPSSLDRLVASQSLAAVEAALRALPKKTRHIFLLNRIHRRTFVEIADALGLSERAVAKHMARALAACEAVVKD